MNELILFWTLCLVLLCVCLGTYAQDYSAYDSFDDGVLKAPPNRCYSCSYIVDELYESGMKSCDEPFNKFGIPMVECQGTCGKQINYGTKASEYSIHRNCLPNCQTRDDEEILMSCCTGDLCNGATNKSPKILLPLIGIIMCVVVQVA